MTAATCTCPGAVCSCGALGVVKDGASVRTSALMMDNATADAAEIAHQQALARRDAARDAYIHDLNNAWRKPEPSSPVADAIKDECDQVEARVFADCIADGHSEAKARSEAAYRAMCHRNTNAWRR